MGKIFDYFMTGNWEETQRISLYKKLGKVLKEGDLSEEKIEKIKEILKKK